GPSLLSLRFDFNVAILAVDSIFHNFVVVKSLVAIGARSCRMWLLHHSLAVVAWACIVQA
ncbi:MAG: hypothetical protein ACPHN0_08205, partial [Candidatus Poseidoniaceae archaeon]